jgi:2-aminobenzoate-CoA ligase
MSDSYPTDGSIPPEWLVPDGQQPAYVVAPQESDGRRANLPDLLVDRYVRAGRGDVAAVVQADTGETWTYRDLEQQTRRAAAALASLGVQAGDRVAVRSGNRAEVVILFVAAWRLGAVAALTPPQARRAEIPFFVQDTGAKVLIVANEGTYIAETVPCLPELGSLQAIVAYPDSPGEPFLAWDDLLAAADADVPDREPQRDEVAVVWHTGGSTGIPKACYHTAYRLVHGAQPSVAAYGVELGDVHMFPAPVGHAAGWLSRTTFSLLPGITFVELEDFADGAKVLAGITEHRVTWFLALPVTWAAMLSAYEKAPERYDLSSLERTYAPFIAASGGWLYDAWARHGLELLNPMGSTAFGNWFMVPRHDEKNPPMTLGRPIDGFEARIVVPYSNPLQDVPDGEIGQLAIRGPSGLTYWNRPELQERDVREGWTVIDDLAQLDEDGFYWYLGRSDMMISTSGYKVAPLEVEKVISCHPAVQEVVVTGAPDGLRGEIVMAWVVLRDESAATAATATEIQEHVRDQMSPYKYPRRIAFLRELPHDPLGKIVVKKVVGWAQGKEEPPNVIAEFGTRV